MKTIRFIAVLALFLTVLSPSLAQAQGLTQPQISAIVGLLEAFNVDSATLVRVVEALEPPATAAVVAPAEPMLDDASETSRATECRSDAKAHVLTRYEMGYCNTLFGGDAWQK